MPTSPPVHRASSHKPRTAWQRDDRKTSSQRGYGSEWRKLRELVIQRDKGLCQECLRNNVITQGRDVDHIISKSKGGTDELDNLQYLCVPCHAHKTAINDSKG